MGTLALNGNNTFGGWRCQSVVIDQGVLVLAGSNGGVATPLADPNVTITSTGTLALQNNGSGRNGNDHLCRLERHGQHPLAVCQPVRRQQRRQHRQRDRDPQFDHDGSQVLNLANANNYSLIIADYRSTPTGVPELEYPGRHDGVRLHYTPGKSSR